MYSMYYLIKCGFGMGISIADELQAEMMPGLFFQKYLTSIFTTGFRLCNGQF
jgi:hypothetical protein